MSVLDGTALAQTKLDKTESLYAGSHFGHLRPLELEARTPRVLSPDFQSCLAALKGKERGGRQGRRPPQLRAPTYLHGVDRRPTVGRLNLHAWA